MLNTKTIMSIKYVHSLEHSEPYRLHKHATTLHSTSFSSLSTHMHACTHARVHARTHARTHTCTHTHTHARMKPMAHNCTHTQARHSESRGEKTDLRADSNNTWCCDTTVTVGQVPDHCGQHWWRGGLSVVTSLSSSVSGTLP